MPERIARSGGVIVTEVAPAESPPPHGFIAAMAKAKRAAMKLRLTTPVAILVVGVL